MKNYTDDRGFHFLPAYKKVVSECNDCLPDADELNFMDDEATGTIKGTRKKYVERLRKDPVTDEVMERIQEEFGEYGDVIFELLDKMGYDGSTQQSYDVSIHIYILHTYFSNEASNSIFSKLFLYSFHNISINFLNWSKYIF